MTRTAALLMVTVAPLMGGCAALTNPVADGIPVRRLPDEVLGRPRSELRQVPLNLLRQTEPDEYKLDKGDVLAVVAEDVIAPAGTQLPVQLPPQFQGPGMASAAPTAATGFPVPVNDDGTISLPLLDPIPVRDKTLKETEDLIRDYATGKKGGKEIIPANANARISVQLLQKRTYLILVQREDSSQAVTVGTGGGIGGGPIIGTDKRQIGVSIRLPAYENDVLHALNATGGVPGALAEDEVTIIRGKYDPNDPLKNATRIPLRVYPEQKLVIREEDIILKDNDILYVQSREADTYYTAGLIGTGQFLLPRDYDLRIVEAIARVRGPLVNGGFSQNAFVAQATTNGLGNPSPSLVSVIRRMPGNREFVIRVDLDRALRDPRENILVMPEDILVMQELPGQAITRYLTQTIRVNTVAETIKSANIIQTTTGTQP
jgi:protein involved in polysaccharide export with SLBB domain